MAWSTRELAELAGTTVNTVRHYHRLGLLAEPERRYNGYKQYGVPHLVCLLRIRRLVDLGVPLSHIGAAMADGQVPPEVLRQVDAELAAEIERLTKARADIAVILRDGAPADAPEGFESVASRLSEADTSLIHIYTRLYDDEALEDLKRMTEEDTDPVGKELDALPPDADEATRQDLAERLAVTIVRNLTDYPWLQQPGAHMTSGEHATRETFVEAVTAVYNPAQIDVLTRASLTAIQQVKPPAGDGGSGAEAVQQPVVAQPQAALDGPQ